MKNRVLHTWNWGTSIFVKYQTPEGVKDVTKIPVDWYFAIQKKDNTRAIEILSKTNFQYKLVEDGSFVKVYINNQPLDIKGKKIKKSNAAWILETEGIQTFEADVLLDKRWYVDKKVEIATDFSKLYYDIETDDTEKKIVIGGHRIVSYAAIDNKGKVYYECLKEHSDEEEKKLLLKFLKLAKKYDILLGWNTNEFDRPYLKSRMRKYGIDQMDEYCWREFAHYDLLKRFRHIFRFDSHLKSFSLNFISNHFLGKGKIEHDEKIIELWRNNKEKLKEYNIEDCILVKELDEKLGVSDMMIRQCQWCGVPPAQFGLYSIIDTYILKKAHEIGEYCPTSIKALEERDYKNERGKENPDETDTEGSKYMGALVLEPKTGKYDNIYTFDFKGLYPSMMRTSNIGYDTLRYEANRDRITNPGTLLFKRKLGDIKPTYFEKKPSVINLAISDLINKRGEYKDLKLKMIEERKNKGQEWERVVSDEIIVKELANSTYGIMGLEYGRYFSVDVAESITLFGQWCINFAKEFFEHAGYNVIYGDTDSVFVSTGKETIDVDMMLKAFHDNLRKYLKNNFNIDESFIQLNFDKQYDSFLMIAKKTYVGHVINIEGKKTDDKYARGIEYHKKNTFSHAAKKQEELIDLVLVGATEKDMEKWILKTKNDFYKYEFKKEELVITQKIGKPVDEYKKTPPLHVRLAQKIKLETGEDMVRHEIEYIITDSSDGMDGILAKDYTGEFDRDYYWSNKTLPILDRILEQIYPTWDSMMILSDNLTLF